MDVASGNIANVATDGYARRRVVGESVGAPGKPAMWSRYDGHGEGVRVGSLDRMVDPLLDLRARREHGNQSFLDTRAASLARIETGLGEPAGEGISAAIAEFGASLHDLSNHPDTSSRAHPGARQRPGPRRRGRGPAPQHRVRGGRPADGAVADIDETNALAKDLAATNEAIKSGGGFIPLEAQRLGLPAYGSDLNPVAVMIGKAMVEIPPKFKNQPPIHPGAKARNHYRNAEGLAEDIKYYGEWMRQKAWERIGHLYPQVNLPKEYGGGKGTVVAWLRARTVPSPNPAYGGAPTPLVNSFLISAKDRSSAIVQSVVDRQHATLEFHVRNDTFSSNQIEEARKGTKAGKAEHFLCIYSGEAITREYIRECARSGQMHETLLAAVISRDNEKTYLSPSLEGVDVKLSEETRAAAREIREVDLSGKTPVWATMVTGGVCSAYGMEVWGDLFTDRQVLALNTFSDLISELIEQVCQDAQSLGEWQRGGQLSGLRQCNRHPNDLRGWASS